MTGLRTSAVWRPALPGETPGELTPEHGPVYPIVLGGSRTGRRTCRWLVAWLVGVPAAIAGLIAVLLLADDADRWLWALPVVPVAVLLLGGALWFALAPGVSR